MAVSATDWVVEVEVVVVVVAKVEVGEAECVLTGERGVEPREGR